MDTPGSESATDSSDTSTSDSSSDGTPSAQIITSLSEIPDSTNLLATTSAIDDLDDSASDVSMSAETDDEDDEVSNKPIIQVNPGMNIQEEPTSLVKPESVDSMSHKRKYSEPTEGTPNGEAHNGVSQEDRKRFRPDANEKYTTSEGSLHQPQFLLPAEIWHHIFTFIPPRTLGMLLQVNKEFQAFLDPSSPDHSITPISKSAVQILKPDSIWRASRRLFRSGMPVPLQGKSELDMWKLACAFSCQFCGKKRSNTALPSDQYHPGPGGNDVVPIWSFGVLSCGPCLQTRTSKEIDLFLSSSVPSQLMAALPFVFLTNELHVLPLATVQNGRAPQTLSIEKVFFQPHIEDIQKEFTEVKAMGSATAEEWIKGLDDRGKERRSDAARWERWEATGGLARMRKAEVQEGAKSAALVENSTAPNSIYPGAATTNGHVQEFQSQNAPQMPTPTTSQLPQPIHLTYPTNGPPRYDSPSQNGFTPYPPRAYPQVRHERSKEEVAELKAARRAEIERRCMLLDPPLTPGVLAHMGSFQAAIQIIQPLNDGAWEVLKPRLLSQREDAEQREKERIAQTRVVQEQLNNYLDPAQVKSEPKDPYDRDWDIQAPLRARIGGYADETIRDGWAAGEKVSKDNCSAFAAEVLIYVRKRFYAEVAKDDAALRATGREPEMDPPDGPFTRKLNLENMKWVFDTKIRPHTEQYRKELFLCNDCEVSKPYGFEGVIQHYAAKHTNALSQGTIVVHWKSEWPEYPPFDPEPNTGKNSYYATAPSASVPYTSSAPQSYGYGAYQPVPVSAPMPAPNQHVYQESPGPYYGNPQFGDQYAAQQHGPYAPPPPYQDPSQIYQAPQYSVPPTAVNNLGYSEPSQDYSQGYGNQYPAATQGYYNHQNQGAMYPTSNPEVANQQPPYNPQDGQYGYPYSQPPAPQPTTQPPPKTEEYKTQLLDVAKNARDVWDSINGLKDIPGSVKVYTIIFHLLKRSRFRFAEDPPLTMIADGLSSNKDMRKVRNINGLLCKACTLGLAGASSAQQKKHFSFPQLVNHFHANHEHDISQNSHTYSLDWTKDMVELPDQSRLSLIPKSPGMTDQKLKLIAEAIPEIFFTRQQTPEYTNHTEPSTRYEQPVYDDAYDPPPSKDNHDKYYATVDSGRPSESGSVTYDSTQYDPRHPRDLRGSHIPEDPQPRYRVLQRAEDYYPQTYQERAYVEPRVLSPVPQARPTEGYQRVLVRDGAPVYLDEQPRYRHEADVEYRVRRAPPPVAYESLTAPNGDYREVNSQGYQSNRREDSISIIPDAPVRDNRYLPAEDAVTQQNRIHEVVAQISKQAKQARENPIREEPADVGSEDGELRAASISSPEIPSRMQQSEASNAAERFLNEFLPGDSVEEPVNKDTEVSRYESQRGDGMVRMYQPMGEPQRRLRDGYEEDERVVRSQPVSSAQEEAMPNGYVLRDRSPQPRQIRTLPYEERYLNSAPGQTVVRERSPELVDRRFKLNNVVYRDERQSSHGMRRTPSSRYARYESVRLENDRARSRSPVYVKMGLPPGQYRDRSPGAHTSHQEPIYRTRTSQPPVEELTYGRAPRPEYYRVYTDEPPARQPQFEYVRVSDPQGDYMLRRPARREAEPVYATYEGDSYSRKPVYESRAPASRPDTTYYEEYDPRHPAPPQPTAAAAVHQVRYQ